MAPVAITLSSMAVARLGSTYALQAARTEEPATVTIRSLAASDAFSIDSDALEITVTEGVPVGNLHLLNVRNTVGRQLKLEVEFDGVPALKAHVRAGSLKKSDDTRVWLTGKPETTPGEYNAFLIISAMDGYLTEKVPITVTVLPRPKKVVTVERCLPGTGPDEEPVTRLNEGEPAPDQLSHESADESQADSPPAEAAPGVAHEDAEPLTEIVTEIVWLDCSEGAAGEESSLSETPEGPVPPGDDPAPMPPVEGARPEDEEPGDSDEDAAEEPADDPGSGIPMDHEPETPADPEEAPSSPGFEQEDPGEEPAPQPEPAREEDHGQEPAPSPEPPPQPVPEPAPEPDLERETAPEAPPEQDRKQEPAPLPEPAPGDESSPHPAVESAPASGPEDAT